MIPRIAHGQKITPEKLNQVIDALNAMKPAASSLPMNASSKGQDLSVPKRPRSFYAVIKESQDRKRNDNGGVKDGEYEWARVQLLSPGRLLDDEGEPRDGEGDPGFVEAQGEAMGSFYDVEADLLYNPAYELNNRHKVKVGSIVKMWPVQPVFENDTLASDGTVEEAKRGFLRRYVFAEPRGAAVEVVQTVPPEESEEDLDWVQANHMGVFDGVTVSLDPTQQDDDFLGDLRGAEYKPTGKCWMLPLRETLPEYADTEEKLEVLPIFTRFKGLYMGELDFDGDKRPLYSFDDEVSVRQFELNQDWLQNPDETWPLSRRAVFVDQPPSFTTFDLYRAVELDGATSSYFVGVGRLGVEDHKGSFGFCRWSRTARRWEWIEGCFKTIAMGVAQENINQGARGTVELMWKDLTVPAAVIGSGMDVKAFNALDELIRDESQVTMAFDRQENLWFIVAVRYPVHVSATAAGGIAEIGQLEFDDTPPGAGDTGIYFILDDGGPPPNFHRVEVAAVSQGHNGGVDPDVPGITMNFVNGLLKNVT